ncbi:MAG: hypothetical protein NZ988_05495 [Thaumarchaeota archaeon]|nr:hypothetical protein [Candidatus Calditenuaceae archaeon]MDW8187478.1 hypothetical protein [Nitrososphaerota archaeon]
MKKRCDLCGAELSSGEWLAVRYACLVSCVPVLQGNHLKSTHHEFYRKASTGGKLATYSSVGLFLASALVLYAGLVTFAATLLVCAVVTFALGTLYRLRLLSTHRAERLHHRH